MASRKGIFITIGILVAITAASFLVWIIPQNNPGTFVISDYEKHLNDVKEIHETLLFEMDKDFQKLLDDKITPEEYTAMAEISSSQINSQIISIIQSQAPEEWHSSYLHYTDSLKLSNSYIRETIVIAEMKQKQNSDIQIGKSLEKISEMKNEINSLSLISDQSRP